MHAQFVVRGENAGLGHVKDRRQDPEEPINGFALNYRGVLAVSFKKYRQGSFVVRLTVDEQRASFLTQITRIDG